MIYLHISEKYSTFVVGMKNTMVYMLRMACRMFCVLVLVCGMVSCGWHETGKVVAQAEMLDKTEHVIYDDTAALGRTIRCLDNPVGRLLMSNTLGKAYYFMGRNYSLSDQIVEAAECYIEADRLQIDDPIYRGRINSNMAYICAQNNNDSLALIFYECASKYFKESGNDWRYAQNLLDRIEFNVKLLNYLVADSLLQIAQSYQLDSSYQARYYETNGLYFYELHQYDSALVYFNRGLNYWRSEEEKCFSYLKVMQVGIDMQDFESAVSYAQYIVEHSNNPNYLSNAYYCLLLEAKENNDVKKLSQYTHARTDALKLLRDNTNKYAESTPKLMEYLQNPHPWRWVWISFPIIIVVCVLLAIGIWISRKSSRKQEADILHHQSLFEFEKGLIEILDKYHSPRNHWRNYSVLKKDLAPWLHDWTTQLDALPLSEQDKIFCTISLIYPNLSDVEIADYMCYTKGSIRVLKNRILKKIGVSSSEFSKFLHNLSNCK